MPRLPPYIAAKGAALVFRRRIPSRLNRSATALRLSVALRTRNPREAGRRAAMLNALAEVAWAMEIPDDQVLNILKAFATAINGLPALPQAAKVEAERRLNDEAVRAFQGRPSRLDDPALLVDFLEEFGWSEMPPAALVAEQLACSIDGHMAAYEDALRRGEALVPELEALRARLAAPVQPPEPERQAKEAPMPPRIVRHEPPTEARAPTILRPGDPDGWLAFCGGYIDRRLAGFLCEEPDEVADAAVGQRWRGGSWGNYQTAVRLWADAVGNRAMRT